MRIFLPLLTIALLASSPALAYDREDLISCQSDDPDTSIGLHPTDR